MNKSMEIDMKTFLYLFSFILFVQGCDKKAENESTLSSVKIEFTYSRKSVRVSDSVKVDVQIQGGGSDLLICVEYDLADRNKHDCDDLNSFEPLSDKASWQYDEEQDTWSETVTFPSATFPVGTYQAFVVRADETGLTPGPIFTVKN